MPAGAFIPSVAAGTIARVKPRRRASARRWLVPTTGRSSPVRLTSPTATSLSVTGRLIVELVSARARAGDAGGAGAGAAPAQGTYAAAARAARTPAWARRTAWVVAAREESTPGVARRGEPAAASATSAWISVVSGRRPSNVTVTQL